MAIGTIENTNTGKTKLIPVASDETLRSYEAKWSVCERNETLVSTLLPHNSSEATCINLVLSVYVYLLTFYKSPMSTFPAKSII